jgi:hypothetical protein
MRIRKVRQVFAILAVAVAALGLFPAHSQESRSEGFATVLEGKWALEYRLPIDGGMTLRPRPKPSVERVTGGFETVAGSIAPADRFGLGQFGAEMYGIAVSRWEFRSDSREPYSEFERNFFERERREGARTEARGARSLTERGVHRRTQLGSNTWLCTERNSSENPRQVVSIDCQMPWYDKIVIHAYVGFPPGVEAGSTLHGSARRHLEDIAASVRIGAL